MLVWFRSASRLDRRASDTSPTSRPNAGTYCTALCPCEVSQGMTSTLLTGAHLTHCPASRSPAVASYSRALLGLRTALGTSLPSRQFVKSGACCRRDLTLVRCTSTTTAPPPAKTNQQVITAATSALCRTRFKHLHDAHYLCNCRRQAMRR